MLYGNPGQVLTQLYGVGVTIFYSAIVTAILYKLTTLVTAGGRVKKEMEEEGLDLAYHGEKGFDIH